MSDLISRNAVWNSLRRRGVTDAEILKIQELEQAEIQKAYELGKAEKTSWIPVNERLPEITIKGRFSEDVLVSDGYDIRVGDYRKVQYINGYECYKWRVYGYNFEDVFRVIAWMPLPELYREERSEEV